MHNDCLYTTPTCGPVRRLKYSHQCRRHQEFLRGQRDQGDPVGRVDLSRFKGTNPVLFLLKHCTLLLTGLHLSESVKKLFLALLVIALNCLLNVVQYKTFDENNLKAACGLWYFWVAKYKWGICTQTLPHTTLEISLNIYFHLFLDISLRVGPMTTPQRCIPCTVVLSKVLCAEVGLNVVKCYKYVLFCWERFQVLRCVWIGISVNGPFVISPFLSFCLCLFVWYLLSENYTDSTV